MEYYYKLIVAYDGTAYCGWQKQKNALSIQEVMMNAASGFVKGEYTITGCSRTDSGVHALGYVVLFVTRCEFVPRRLTTAFNAYLPDDIVVHNAMKVDADFHPRYTTLSKHYRYTIFNYDYPLPQYMNYSFYYRKELDVEAMKKACSGFVGQHDFKGFCSIKTTVEDTVRTIISLDVTKDNYYIHIDVKGNGFLYHMVRIIAGTLIDVGLGRIRPEEIESIIASKNRMLAGKTAPARGLTLVGIDYSGQGESDES